MSPNWHFDEAIEDSTRAWLTKALEPAVGKWFRDAYAEVRNRLDKHGENRTEASLYDAELTGLDMEYLCVLICERDILEPKQCLVFVGSDTYTRRKCDKIQAHYIEHTKRQGGKATIVERDL